MFLLIPLAFKVALAQQLTLFLPATLPSYTYSSKTQQVYYSLDRDLWKMKADGTQKKKLGQGSLPVLSDTEDRIAIVQKGNLYQREIEKTTLSFVAPAASFPRFHEGALYFLARSGFFFHLWFYELSNIGAGTPLTNLESTNTILYFNFSPTGQIVYTAAPYDVLAERVQTEKAATYVYGDESTLFLPEGEGGNITASPEGDGYAYVSRFFSSPCLYYHDLKQKTDTLIACGQPIDLENPAFTLQAMEPVFTHRGKLGWIHKKENMYYLTLYHKAGGAIDHLFTSLDPIFSLQIDSTLDRFFFLMKKKLNGQQKVALFSLGYPQIQVNGQLVHFDSIHPVLKANTLYVPIKPVGNLLSFQWEWDAKQKKTVGLHPNAFIELFPRKGVATVNGTSHEVELPVLEGHQFAPLALLIKAIGGTMEWKPKQFLAEVIWHIKE